MASPASLKFAVTLEWLSEMMTIEPTLKTRVEARELGTQTFDVFDKGINGV